MYHIISVVQTWWILTEFVSFGLAHLDNIVFKSKKLMNKIFWGDKEKKIAKSNLLLGKCHFIKLYEIGLISEVVCILLEITWPDIAEM